MPNDKLEDKIKKLEEKLSEVEKQIVETKSCKHVCFITYHKLKLQKKIVKAEVKKLKAKTIPDIIA
ncbi:MAG: hypothetical protein OIF36_01005 [Alphaproteobacteria bacterium]|nr:hypothetical protein [Alphaproteobacteria bacterium]